MEGYSDDLCLQLPWVREIFLSYNLLNKSENENPTEETHKITEQLDEIVSRTVRLIEKNEMKSDHYNLINCLGFLEKLIYNLNEFHTSSEIPRFDEKLMPLIEKYADLLMRLSRNDYSDMETSMKKFESFFTGLSTHPALKTDSTQRTEHMLIKLIEKLKSDESKDFLESQSFIIHLAGESPENLESSQNINDLHRASNNTADNCGDDSLKSNKEERTEVELVTGIGNEIDKEPLVIPESPLKYPQPTCVGTASICEITPFSSGLMFPLTPPQAKLLTVNQPTLIQTSLNPSDFEIPAPILNRRLDLQKTLRQRFRVPHAITPSEKKNRRTIMCTLRSRRRLKQSSWKVHENTYLKPVNLSPGHQLFIETGSDQSSSFSQIALYLSPDIENYAPTLVTPNPPEVVEKQNLNQKNSIETNVSTTPQRQTSLLKNDGAEKEDTPEELKNENTYSELKKSMEGNLLGCEASLSDVELMDEIESSLNLEGEEDDASYLSDPVVYIDPLTMSCKTKNLPETVSTMLSTSNTSGTTIETSCEPAKVLNSLNGKEIIKNTQNQTGLQEQVERRRSSRLAGIPALPLKYTSEPLPNRNKSNNRKPLLKRPDSSIEQRNESKATTPAKKQPESIIDVPQLIPEAKNEPQNTRVSWQEVRLLLPPCWATILENHVKAHHSDETMRFQGILGARCPTVYCECTPTQKSESID